MTPRDPGHRQDLDSLKALNFIPFSFLAADQRAALRADMVSHEAKHGELLIHPAERDDKRVFLLLDGVVEVLDGHDASSEVVGLVTRGHYFGERAVLFNEPRTRIVRVSSPTAHVMWMEGERFLRLMEQSPIFAQAMGHLLREKQKIFVAFDHFMAALQHGVAEGHIDFHTLVERYRALKPALHAMMDSPELDIGGLSYALKRLPDNITQTFMWFLADDLPGIYEQPQRYFRAVPTDARRRTVYEMMPGKSIVLLRDGLSDLIDLISCMCLVAVEARKLRKRLSRPAVLGELLASQGERDDAAQAEALLQRLPLSEEERDGLRRLWPGHTVERIRETVLHHEDFRVCIWKRIGNYNSSHADVWTNQLASATERLLGSSPAQLPEDLRVHIISSNTHSVTNCLSAWLTERGDDIRAWGRRQGLPIVDEDWHNPHDLAVALSRDYIAAHPDAARERAARDEHAGIHSLEETAFTGIQVQLFDTQSLCERPLDPTLHPIDGDKRALIVNIDYAFGQQAEEIITNLIQLFGPNLDSVNVLGKAGGLCGHRGEILLPTAFLEQSSELFAALDQDVEGQAAALKSLAGDRRVHVGPVLTVSGTLLQNATMLHFYRRIWRCVGLEMEGSYYHRPLQEARALGLVRPDLALRYLYYVSDLPLHTESNLSGSMRAIEGIPPLYAITRHVLNAIFSRHG